MCRAFSFPAEVMAAPPTGMAPIASHSRCTESPALRRITPARPPPSLRSLLAALTMASASISVRSPCCKTILSSMLIAKMISAAGDDGRAGALQRVRTDAIPGLQQAQRGAARRLLRFGRHGQLRQHLAAGEVVAVLIGIDDVPIDSGQFALPDAVEEGEKLHIPAAAHGFSRDKGRGDAFGRSRQRAQIGQYRAGRVERTKAIER